MIAGVAALVVAAHVVVVDGGGDVAAAVAAIEAGGDTASVLDSADVDSLEGCVSDDCYVEVAAAHGAEFVVVVGKDRVTKIEVMTGAVVDEPKQTEPTTPTDPATTPPPPEPKKKGPPAATRPPRDDRPVSPVGNAIMIGGGVGAGLGVVVMGLGAYALLQPGASEQHTTGLVLVGGGGLIVVAGCVAYGVGEGLREDPQPGL